MLDAVTGWTSGEVLGFDFETTGIDRFADVPVSYALVHVVGGVVLESWSGLIDPGREIPAEATLVHGITTERAHDEGMPLSQAIALVTDAVVSAGARGVPLAGMKLDYDLTILEMQAVQLSGAGFLERGWRGPLLDAVVIDRHFDPDRKGRRTLVDLCAHYGIDIGNPHEASVDAIASVEVVYALADRYGELSRDRPCPAVRRPDPLAPAVDGGARRLAFVAGDGRRRSPRLPVACSASRPLEGGLNPRHALRRSQTMSTPSFSARTTLAGCFLSM